VIELGELTLFEGDDAVLKIHADGSTEMGHRSGKLELKPGQVASSSSLPVTFQAGPTIKPDGTIESKGQAVARLKPDGTIVNLKTNVTLPAIVGADKVTITERGTTITIELAADGTLSVIGAKKNHPDKPMRLAGADTPGKRKIVLALIAVMTGGMHKVDTDEPDRVSTPATVQ